MGACQNLIHALGATRCLHKWVHVGHPPHATPRMSRLGPCGLNELQVPNLVINAPIHALPSSIRPGFAVRGAGPKTSERGGPAFSEDGPVTSESQRVTSESQRVTSERKRVTSESFRARPARPPNVSIYNETAPSASSERNRVTSESQRVTYERKHVTSERKPV